MSSDGAGPGPLSRRVITGLGEDGKAKIIYDDQGGNIRTLPNGARFQNPWWTDKVPVDCSPKTNGDPTGVLDFNISNAGSVASIVSMPPGANAPMHSTKSIDYAVVLEGELELELDSGDRTVLKTGDFIVQRETLHAWHNLSTTQWCKVLFILVATENATKMD